MKKIISVLLVLVLSTVSVCNISAQDKSLLDYSKEEIALMSDDEYLDLYGSYYIDALENKKTDIEIKKELANLGIEFEVKRMNETRASFTSDIDLNITLSRRAGQAYTYVSAVATSTTTLSMTATEDCMSLEWEPAKGSYYGYSTTQNTTLKDYSKRNNGILVFNVNDTKIIFKGQYALASALIIFKDNSDVGDIGIKYIHTYSDKAPTLTIGGNVNFIAGVVNGGVSISLSTSFKDCTWQKAYLYS